MVPRRAIAPLLAAALLAGCNAIFGIQGGDLQPGSGGATSSTSTGGGASTTSTGPGSGGATSSSTSTSTGPGGGPPAGMTLIPGGTFDFFVEQTGMPTKAKITHDFYLDTLEVTVARFKAWVDAGQKFPCDSGACSLDPGGPYAQAMTWDSAWNPNAATTSFKDANCNNAGNSDIHDPTYTQPGGGALPMGCLDWFHAVAFCASEGKRLPTETEWQYAASGRDLGRMYPWGSQDPSGCSLAIWNNNAPGPGYNGCAFPKPGGSSPAGAARDGLLDMGGSIYEWTWDYDGVYPTAMTTDYAGPTLPAYRSTRGGSWVFDASRLRTTYRDATPPDTAFADVGVRCAKTKL